MLKKLFVLSAIYFAITLSAGVCTAEEPQPAEKYELKLITIFEGSKPEYIFAIGESGFRSIDSLKKFLASRPKGSELTWNPGCDRMGGEPLLSSETEMEEFRRFLNEHQIKFNLIPSG